MPIEYETKFLLKSADALIEKLTPRYATQKLHQIYVTKHNRFRRIDRIGKKSNNAETTCYHTFKKKFNGDLLEIESEISLIDFDIVASVEGQQELCKTRFTIKQKYGVWDVDFLRAGPNGPVYFACAECEQPKNYDIEVPDILSDHIEYIIPYEHSTWFSNFKLSNREYADTVMQVHGDKAVKWKP